MLNDLQWINNVEKQNASIYDAKEIFGENRPYIIETRLDGDHIIFNDHFISTAREALSNGCMARMNSSEKLLFLDFIQYQNGERVARDISRIGDKVSEALDVWMSDEIHCYEHLVMNGCYDNDEHTWVSCSQ